LCQALFQMKKILFLLIFGFIFSFFSQAGTFTKEDRDRMIRLEILLEEHIKASNRRMDELEKKIDSSELRLSVQIQNTNYLIFTLCGIYMAIFGGFYLMFMRFIKVEKYRIKAEVIDELSTSGKIINMINELQSASFFDSRVEKILKKYNLIPSN
jgi:hypothetical protein